jgi:branched-chain amino acid transport system permease protein
MANMWNLLAGYCGLICLCLPAFIGLAGYMLVIITWAGLPFWVGIIAGGAIAALFALAISPSVFRLKGVYFAIGTLILPEALRYVFYIWKPIAGDLRGGGAGYMVKGLQGITLTDVYWYALIVAAISIFVIKFLLESRMGLGLAAIRDNDRAAASSGVNVYRLKLYAFLICAFITGMAGAVYYVKQAYIEPNSAFNISWTMQLILATVIGGIATKEGPVFGAIVTVFLYFMLARFAGLSLVIQGGILILIMLVAPQGIIGTLRKTRIYHKFIGYATRF